MAQARFTIASEHAYEFRDLSKRLREAGKQKGGGLRKKLRTKITEAGKPVVAEVKEVVRTLPVTSHGGGTAQRSTHAALQAGRRAVIANKKPQRPAPPGKPTKSGKPRKARARVTVRQAIERAAQRPHGLRESIARGVKLQVTARGVRFVASTAQLPPGQQSLPRHLDSERGWDHPTFGDWDKKVHQRGKPWFATTIKKHAPQMRKAIVDAMEETKSEIEGT